MGTLDKTSHLKVGREVIILSLAYDYQFGVEIDQVWVKLFLIEFSVAKITKKNVGEKVS